MKKYRHHHRSFSLAERSGIGALLLAIMLGFIDVRLAAIPLIVFLVLCFVAPLIPCFSFFVPIISRGRTERQAVALTFDDGPDPGATPDLLDLLDRHQAEATFFVTGKRAERYPDLVRKILSRGHTIGNHTYSHNNFIMLCSHSTLSAEIEKAQQVLKEFGIVPLAFRPPVGVTSPRLKKVLRQNGMYVVNFSRRAGDRGNRQVKNLSARILTRLRSGDIIMLHDIRTRNETLYPCWLDEVDRTLSGIKAQGMEILPLSELIHRPVMTGVGKNEEGM